MAARAAAAPGEVALEVEGGEDLGYGDWESRANAIARGLAARGVRPGDRVALLFDAPRWTDFATAHLGVMKAGGVAVLLSAGASSGDLSRALAHSGAAGLLCAPTLAPGAVRVWAAQPDEVGRGHDTRPVVDAGAVPGTIAELVYPPSSLTGPRASVRLHRDLDGPGVVRAGAGWLVHTWAPGSLAGQHAMALVLGRSGTCAATLAAFTPEGLCALVARRRAVACGLTPALAAAVVASDAPRRHGLGTVSQVMLSGRPSADLRARLQAAFPGAALTEVEGEGPVATPPVPHSVTAPVAMSQEAMLWHEQFTPGSFNLPCLVRRYEGQLDVTALEWALAELIRRHEPLRSTFEIVSGEPRQVVRPHEGLHLETVDLGDLRPPERDAEVARLLADATGRPFDLATGPLFDPRLVRLGRDDHLLVVRLHHTVFDDWSVDVFRRELSALYTAGLAGEPSPLVEPRTSFTDFCRRQRARLTADVGAGQRSWWRRELAGAPLAVQVPIGDDGAGGARPGPGEPLRVELPPSLAAELRALSPRLRATPFMTVLAAFSVLLGRATGQDDLVIATVVAHRGRSDLEPLVGCFTKKIPVRLRLDGDPTFPELVGRTRTALLGALSHQDVAFDAVVQDSLGRPAADHGVVPQVAVVFQGEAPQQVKLSMPGLVTSPYQVAPESRRERHFSSGPERPPERDGNLPVWGDGIYLGTFLILSLLETPDGMALVARGVFDRPAGRRLLQSFQALLADVAADPSRPVSALSTDEPAPTRGAPSVPPDDLIEWRGFRARRSRLEAALAGCPSVAEVAVAVRHDRGGEPRLVAYVVAGADPPPTLAQLRHALWRTLPGVLWPADAVVVEALARLPDGRLDVSGLPPPGRTEAPEPSGPDPTAAVLAAMWGEVVGRPVERTSRYWQDFSFLDVLVEARQAGLHIADEHVVRSRTPEMLAAAMTTPPAL